MSTLHRVSYLDAKGRLTHEWRPTLFTANDRVNELHTLGMEGIDFEEVEVPWDHLADLIHFLNTTPNSPPIKENRMCAPVPHTTIGELQNMAPAEVVAAEASLRAAPIVARIRDAVSSDRCDGSSSYAHGVNAAVARHTEMIDLICADMGVAAPVSGMPDLSLTPTPRLIWSDTIRPNSECQYDHVTAQTPFGRILITWKGWKEVPGYAIDEHPMAGVVYWTGNTLAHTKERAEKQFFDAALQSLTTDTTNPTGETK